MSAPLALYWMAWVTLPLVFYVFLYSIHPRSNAGKPERTSNEATKDDEG